MAKAVPLDELVEDVTFMLDTGEHPERVSMRLGVSLKALEVRLRRHGYAELAGIFNMHVQRKKARAWTH